MKNNGGFSLVELIVVIAIMAILAGVAVPTYTKYIAKANDSKVVAELDEIKTAAIAAGAGNAVEVTGLTLDHNTEVTEASFTFGGSPTAAQKTAVFNDFEAFLLDSPSTTAVKVNMAGSSYETTGATWSVTNGWEAK